jgi:hypothetical protein
MPQRVQLSRRKGWRLPPNTVSVARPSKWGNPFRVERYGRREAVRRYRRRLHGSPEGLPDAARRELRGKNLACWCPLDGEPCHADALLEIANE